MNANGVGKRVPPIALGVVENGEIRRRALEGLLAGKRAVVVGVPGAFTPVCTREHLPDFIISAERLRAGGIDLMLCVTPNDPWTTAAWAQQLDPGGTLVFLSDGNLDLAEAIGARFRDTEHFMGWRSRRYLMQTENAVIKRLTIETQPLALTCTRAQDVMLD